MAETPDYYEILQVHPKASLLVIKKAYRTLLLSGGHPDLGGSKTEAQLLTEAYEVLADPDRRMAYDRGRLPGRLSPATIIISICPHCGVYNRVRSETKLLIARCGKCGHPIGKVKVPTGPLRPPPRTLPWRWLLGLGMALILACGGALGYGWWSASRDPLQEALDLEDRGQLATAAERLQAVVAAEPRNGLAHQRLGRILEAQRELDPAIQEYRLAARLEPDSPRAQFLLGQALMRRGRLGEAEDCLRRSLDLDGQDVATLVQLAKLFVKTDRTDRGIVYYQRAIPLDPRNSELRCSLAAVYQLRGELDKAALAYRQALSIEPRHRDALLQLGGILASRGAYGEALTQFQRAALLQYDDPDLHFRIAELHRLSGDLANALRELRVAQTQAKTNRVLRDRIDRALEALGG